MKAIDKFIANLTPGHFEGMILYAFGSLMITGVMIANHKSFKDGLKGTNGLWETPEIVVYIWLWLFPHFVMSITFLQFRPPDQMYWTMDFVLLFALTGRWGIEFLLTRGRVDSTKIDITKTTITDDKKD